MHNLASNHTQSTTNSHNASTTNPAPVFQVPLAPPAPPPAPPTRIINRFANSKSKMRFAARARAALSQDQTDEQMTHFELNLSPLVHHELSQTHLQLFLTKLRLHRHHTRIYFNTSLAGLVWESIQALIGLGEFVGVVMVTYLYTDQHVPLTPVPLIQRLHFITTFVFVVDLVLKTYLATSLPSYLWSFDNIVDCLIVLPPSLLDETDRWFYLLQSLRILRTHRFLKLLQQRTMISTSLLQLEERSMKWDLGFLLYSVVLIVFWMALWMTILEPHNITDFFVGLYFSAVTLSTVGFGELSPVTDPGRMFLTIAILVILVVLPAQSAQLISTFKRLQSKHLGTHMGRGHRSFVLVCGGFKPSDVYVLVDELNSDEHQNLCMRLGLGVDGLRLRFVSSLRPSADMRECFADRAVNTRAEYVVADPGNIDDLVSIEAHLARAILIMSDNTLSGNDHESDARAVMFTVCLKTVNPSAVMVVEVFSPETKTIIDTLHVSYCYSLWQVNSFLAGRTLCCTGFSTFLFNLLTTSRKGEETLAKDTPQWLSHYVDGRDREIYSIALPPIFFQLSFLECAHRLFVSHNLILIGVSSTTNRELETNLGVRNSTKMTRPCSSQPPDSASSSSNVRYFINPSAVDGGFEIGPGTIAFVLSKSQPHKFKMFESEMMDVLVDEYQDMVQQSTGLVGTPSLVSQSSAESLPDLAFPNAPDTPLMSFTPRTDPRVTDSRVSSPASVTRVPSFVTPTFSLSPVQGPASFASPHAKVPLTVPPEHLWEHCVIIGSLRNAQPMLQGIFNSQQVHPCFSAVVFLHPSDPDPRDARMAMDFASVFFIKGHGNNQDDLHRASVTRAKAVFIRREAHTTPVEQESWEEVAQSIKTALTLENMLALANKDPFVCCECYKTKHAELQSYTMMEGCLDPMKPFSLSPAMVSGRIINHELWNHALMVQLVFKPFLPSLLPLLIHGQTVTSKITRKRVCSNVELGMIPETFEGTTFGQLFVFMLRKKKITIGLMRCTFAAPWPYVHTAPPVDLLLDKHDLLYFINSWEWDGTAWDVATPQRPVNHEPRQSIDFSAV